MKFNKKVYWERRRKGFRGQIAVPGTKEFYQEKRKVNNLARKLWLQRQKEKDAKKEITE